VVQVSNDTGNVFISLTPFDAEPIVPPPPPPDKTDGSTTASATTTGSTDPNKPEAPPAPLLSTFGYEIDMRGTYDSLQSFLRNMDQQKELMEVFSITLQNEAFPDPSKPPTTDPNSSPDPKFPIRLNAKLRLVLQPQQ
jgi:hypothetical protein